MDPPYIPYTLWVGKAGVTNLQQNLVYVAGFKIKMTTSNFTKVLGLSEDIPHLKSLDSRWLTLKLAGMLPGH